MKAKELIAHGEFQAWLEANAGERGYRTLAKWMKLAKVNLDALLADNPTLKGLQDAYVAAGVLPDAEYRDLCAVHLRLDGVCDALRARLRLRRRKLLR